MEAPHPERERVFDAFRHWGYLEADLDPLGFLRPQPQPDLQIESEFARKLATSTAGRSAWNSCTSSRASAAVGFRSTWRAHPPRWIRNGSSNC